jgi:WD40 repeat protein
LDYNGLLIVRNATSFDVEDTLQEPDYITSFAVAQGQLFYTSGHAIKVRKLEDKSTFVLGYTDIKNNVMVASPDGRFLGIGGDTTNRRTNLALFEIASGLYQELPAQPGRIMNLDFSPNNKELLSCSSYGSIIAWDIAANKERMKLEEDRFYPILDASFSRDGKYITSCHNSNKILIWDARQGILLRTLKGFANSSGVNSVRAVQSQ